MSLKSAFLSATALVLVPATTLATEFYSFKELPTHSQPSPWTGLYAGLNLGYGVSTSDSAQNNSIIVNDNWANWASYNSTSPTGCNGSPCASFSNPTYGTAALANSGSASLTQKGIIGGGQIGISKLIAEKFVLGLEFDFQGSGMSGSGNYSASASDHYSNGKSGWSSYSSRTFIGGGTNGASVNWLSTVRPKAGLLVNPYLQLYGTGGLSFGNVSLSSQNILLAEINTTTTSISDTRTNNIYAASGSGHKSQIMAGWTMGGGFEYLLNSNWSIKSEAIYYNLGSLNAVSSPLIIASSNGILSSNIVNSEMSYQGIIARAGINYHFTW